VFGTWAGQSFADNSKYLYLDCQSRPKIRPVWITKSDEVLKQLTDADVEVYHAYSLKGAVICARAKYVIITHTVKDVNEFSVMFSKVVQLTHGAPIKRIGWDRDQKTKRRILKLIRDYIWGEYYRVFVSASEVRKCFSSAFRCRMERVIATGYPRNDILRNPKSFTSPLVEDPLRLPFNSNEHVIVYLPTFRMFDTTPFYEKADFEAINEALESTNYNLLIKPHPGTSPPPVDGFSNIFQTNKEVDIYPHLHRFDALVTDYSSIAFDYSVLERPILHFIYDLEAYRRNRGFYFELEEILPGDRTESSEGLTRWLQEITTNPPAHHREYQKVFVQKEGSACEAIVSHLQKSKV
jgi:CDP-glycerol glycerophosphotransferase (TagB/SpsB family)